MKQTKWDGLWRKRAGLYASIPISSKSLIDIASGTPSVNILVRKNKFKEKGDNKPDYVYVFCDQEAKDAKISSFEEVVDKESFYDHIEELKDGVISTERAIEIARQAVRDHEYGCSIDDLVVDIECDMKESSFSLDENYRRWGQA